LCVCINIIEIHTCMKIAQWSPLKTVIKEGEEGQRLRKSNIDGVNLSKYIIYLL
jgi:hypothetical protein